MLIAYFDKFSGLIQGLAYPRKVWFGSNANIA